MKKTIVYMVAGMSSRFGGKIKQFAKVGKSDETLIEVSIEQAKSAGFDEIVFIVGEKTEKAFKDMFKTEYKGMKVKYALQTFDPLERNKPWGTVDALISAKDVIDSSFVLCNGDDLYGEDAFLKLKEHLDKNSDFASIGYLLKDVLPDQGFVNRGIFQVDENSYVTDIVETFNITKENFSSIGLKEDSLCSMNIFALNESIFKVLIPVLKNFKKENKLNKTAECLLPTELAKKIISKDIKIKLYETTGKWLGVTNPEDEEKVKLELEKQK